MKSIIINNDKLKKAFKKISGIPAKNTVVPVLENIMIYAVDSSLHMYATDMEVTTVLTVDLDAPAQEPINILLPFFLLNNIANLSGSVPVTIETDDQSATITAGEDKYEIKALEKVAEFPKVPEFPKDHTLAMDPEFASWVNRALPFVSSDTLRPSMTKVCLDIKKKSLTIVATDANVLFTKTFEMASSEKVQHLISPKVARAIQDVPNLTISWNEKTLAFRGDNLVVYAVPCVEKYVPYDKVIPDNEANLELNRVDLIFSLEKVSLTAGSTNSVSFWLKQKIGLVEMQSEDADRSRASKVTLPGDYSGECEKISVNVGKLLKMLKQVEFTNVGLAIEHSNKAMLIKSTEDPLYTGLVMPLLIA